MKGHGTAFTLAFFLAFLTTRVVNGEILPARGVTDDLWDVSRGAVVTSSSPVLNWGGPYWFSDIDNMFGGTSAGVESDTTIFGEATSGTVHWVEWQTLQPVTVRSFMLHAAHDDAPRDANYRGFSEFRLFARDSYGTFQQIYDLATGNPYNTTPPPSDCIVEFSSPCHLSLWANLTPTTAQQFRAEFVQYGPSMGPRVLELDGYSYATVPEPSTLAMFLGLGGMGMIGAWRRRKRTA